LRIVRIKGGYVITNYKSRDEWRRIIGALSDKEFEYLCFELVRSMPGFVNHQLRDGSADDGRDIEAEYISKMPDGNERREKWWFECKKYSKGVPFDDISGKIYRANGKRINTFVVMSNMHLTPQCQDNITDLEKTSFCRVMDWAGLNFQNILFKYPHICDQFFPDEKIPQQLDVQHPQELIQNTQKTGLDFGLEIKLKKGQIPPKNIYEAAEIIKDALINIDNVDLNIKSLIYSNISGLFLSIRKNKDALLFINESLKITPSNTAALMNKALILENLGKLDDSIECCDHILRLEEDNKSAINIKSHILWKKGQLDTALDLVENALEIDSEFIMAISNKIQILRDLGKLEEALNYLESKLDTHEDSKTLLNIKVTLLIDLKDFKEAMRLNNQIIEIDPNNLDAINNKGVIYENNSQYQYKEKYIPLAIECFENVIEKDKNGKYPIGWANKVVCMVNNGQLDEADDLLNEIHDFYPTSPSILNGKGLSLIRKGNKKNIKKSIKFFDRSLKYEPSAEVVINKAQAYLLLHQNDRVVKTINSISNNQNALAWEIKGYAFERLHQLNKSKECFKKSKEYNTEPKSLLE
jgi:tetratricopeptide (TPR) repeat protein